MAIEPIRVEPLPAGGPLLRRWNPAEGEQTRALLRRALEDADAQAAVLESSSEILGRGIRPGEGATSITGLVVGYVQSGKTLSFTTTVALARDNGFPIVIVLAGTKNPLLAQSAARLGRDLAIETEAGVAAWRPLNNPTARDEGEGVRQVLREWADLDAEPDEKPTLLITVLKQKHRIESLTELLRSIGDLSRVPVLVIDDEADQASLNTKVRKMDESTTYSHIRHLRAALPLHTYLQYTATPQAPLLINIEDTLSPDFVYVLNPGNGYVGGREFFVDDSPYIKVIPEKDIVADDDDAPQNSPESLRQAMREFFVGLAAAASMETGTRRRRSMLMHPSRLTAVHASFACWARAAIAVWQAALEQPEGDPGRDEVVQDFASAYAGLNLTDPNLPSFETVLARLPRAIRRTRVIEFNAAGRTTTPRIEWETAKGWILVGGQAVDRGFTVVDLTVTYMPRNIGIGNADALQQRARFFGYHRRYLGQCRIYLPELAKEAFESYVAHEQAMRTELERMSRSSRPLADWDRRFLLSDELRPCRDTIIALGDEYVRGSDRTDWVQQRDTLMHSRDILSQNMEAANDLVASLEGKLRLDDRFQSESAAQRHWFATVPLREVIDFLLRYRLPNPLDTLPSIGLLLRLEHIHREDPAATAAVYRMRPEYRNARGRTVDGNGLFPRGFLQGRTGRGLEEGKYPGDSFFSAADRVTLQLHWLRLKKGEALVDLDPVPMLAVRVPEELAPNWIAQPTRPRRGR